MKETIDKAKRQLTEWGKTFAIYMYNHELNSQSRTKQVQSDFKVGQGVHVCREDTHTTRSSGD